MRAPARFTPRRLLEFAPLAEADTATAPADAPAPTDPAVTDPEAGLLAEWWVGSPYIANRSLTTDGRDLTNVEWQPRDPTKGEAFPLRLVRQDTGFGHTGAEDAGFAVEVWQQEDGSINARGRLFDNEAGREVRQRLLGGRKFATSIDGGDADIEFVCTEEDPEWGCVDGVAVFSRLEVVGVTAVSIPAIADAGIVLEDPATGEPAQPAEPAAAQTASATTYVAPAPAPSFPVRPPAAWFRIAEPDLGEPFDLGELVEQPVDGGTSWAMPLTIGDDGLVFGHLAVWGQCHVGYPGACVTPPDSPTGYAHFHIGETIVDDGARIATGNLTVGCDHAALRLLAPEARDHYANQGLAWARVRVTSGKFGPWVSGAVLPTITPAQLEVIRSGALSGDWRNIGGALELVAALTVPSPGFPIARQSITAAALPTYIAPRIGYRQVNGDTVALVAAGRVLRCGECAQTRALAAGAARLRPAPAGRELAALVEEVRGMRRVVDRLERRGLAQAREAALARIQR